MSYASSEGSQEGVRSAPWMSNESAASAPTPAAAAAYTPCPRSALDPSKTCEYYHGKSEHYKDKSHRLLQDHSAMKKELHRLKLAESLRVAADEEANQPEVTFTPEQRAQMAMEAREPNTRAVLEMLPPAWRVYSKVRMSLVGPILTERAAFAKLSHEHQVNLAELNDLRAKYASINTFVNDFYDKLTAEQAIEAGKIQAAEAENKELRQRNQVLQDEVKRLCASQIPKPVPFIPVVETSPSSKPKNPGVIGLVSPPPAAASKSKDAPPTSSTPSPSDSMTTHTSPPPEAQPAAATSSKAYSFPPMSPPALQPQVSITSAASFSSTASASTSTTASLVGIMPDVFAEPFESGYVPVTTTTVKLPNLFSPTVPDLFSDMPPALMPTVLPMPIQEMPPLERYPGFSQVPSAPLSRPPPTLLPLPPKPHSPKRPLEIISQGFAKSVMNLADQGGATKKPKFDNSNGERARV